MDTSLSLEQIPAGLGARFTSGLGFRLPADYGDPDREYSWVVEAVGLVDRSYRGVLLIDGNEVLSFLNGIFSSRVDQLEIDAGQLSTFLTGKGKLIGDFRIYRVAAESCLVIFREPLREEFQKSLGKYAFLSDIEVADATDRHPMYSLEGSSASDVVGEVFSETFDPGTKGMARRVFAWRGGRVALYPGAAGGIIDVQLLEGSDVELWNVLLDGVRARGGGPVGQTAAEILRVEAGRPRFGVDYDGTNFPNDAGLEDALDYSKCYVGQEVVARMKTYGQASRRIVGLRLPASPGVPPGTTLVDVDETARELGQVTSAAVSPCCGTIALGMVRRGHWEPGTRLLAGPPGPGTPVVEVVALPFSTTS